MDIQALKQLVEQAKQDPAFFHALVFDTESVLTKLDYLDRNTKAALVAISPEAAITLIAGTADRINPSFINPYLWCRMTCVGTGGGCGNGSWPTCFFTT